MENLVLLAIPFFFLSMGIEFWYGKKKGLKWYNFEDTITNLNLGIGSQATGVLSKLLVLGTYMFIYDNWRFITLPENAWWMFIVSYIVFDYIYYWAHRLGHEWNYMWGAHVVHHQSREFNLSVALRQSWTQNILSFFLFLPMAFLGFNPIYIVAAAGIDTLFQYWIHTKAINKMPRWFEFIFNTPSHHRVHHATNPQYLDKNYAATFVLWDRLHKTYAEEVETPVYGITKPFNSLNPVWANMHYYQEMWQGMKREKGIFNKFAIIFRGPEYLGKLLNEPIEAPKEIKPVALSIQIYVFIQFVILSAGLIKYLINYEELTTFYKIAGFALIVATTHICAGLLENKKMAIFTEAIRLAAVVLILNSLYFINYKDWFVIMLVTSISISLLSGLWLLLNPFINKLLVGEEVKV